MNPITKAFNFPEEILSKYDIIQEMGRGAFSTVYKIKSKKDNTFYCLKKINIKKTPDRKNEVNILSKLNHPNLVKYISSYEDEEGIYIIMEFCIYGDLYSLLHMVKKKKVYVNEEIIWDIAYQCLLGLEYLHSNQIIHRDIKLLNIFMSTNKIVKIGDMGMSKILSKKEMKLSRVGTPLFLAPELVMKEKYDFKADIWSLGCSIYHLAKTAPPFNDENLIKLGQAIVNDNPPELPGCYSDDLKFFVNKLMTKNKKLRPNATEALTFIPQKVKDKFEKNNDKHFNLKKTEEKKQRMKDINNQKNNKSINNNEINNSKNYNDNKNIMNNQKLLNIPKSPIKEQNNELISGQTFYKFFRKNTDKSQRKLTSSILGLKKGKISSSIFDSKNMNSLLIMSKTMGNPGYLLGEEARVTELGLQSKDNFILFNEMLDEEVFYEATKSNNGVLKRLLYQERLKTVKDINIIYKSVKEMCPWIKYTRYQYRLYAQKNLFIDTYFYTDAFFRNNFYKLDKAAKLYFDYMDRYIDDKRLKEAGYIDKYIFIPISDWKPAVGHIWNYKESINPISTLYYMMKNKKIEALKSAWGDSKIFFLGDMGYFMLDLKEFNEKQIMKFKMFVDNLASRQTIIEDEDEENPMIDSTRAITTDIINRIEKTQHIKIDYITGKKDQKEDITKTQLAVKVDKSKEELATMAGPKTKLEIERDEKKKQLVERIETVAARSNNAEEALEDLDNDDFVKNLLLDLAAEEDNAVKISAARASRMVDLNNKFHDKNVDGVSVKKLLDEYENSGKEELSETALPIHSINEEWQHMKFINFNKDYNVNEDIVAILDSFSTKTTPVSVRDINIENTTTSEDLIETWSVAMEDADGVRFTLKFDLPKFKNGNLLRLRGNDKALGGQLMNLPIIKTDADTCQITSNYNKIFIRTYGTSTGKSNEEADRLLKTFKKLENNTKTKIRVTTGDNSKICAKYELPIDYIDLSSQFNTISIGKTTFYFNQDELRSKYKVDDSKGLPVGYDEESKSVLYTSYMFSHYLVNMLTSYDAAFKEAYELTKPSVKYTYSKASILNTEIPVIVIMGYNEGLTTALKKANVTYAITDKPAKTIVNDINKNNAFDKYPQEVNKVLGSGSIDTIKFQDGYLIYALDYNSSLLVNGLKECDTEDYSIKEINTKGMWVNFLDEFGGRIRADGLDNFYDLMVDPITKKVCEQYGLPTDYCTMLAYANMLLADNKYNKHTDLTGNRYRYAEIIAAHAYKCIAKAYADYHTMKKRSSRAIMSMKQSAIIDSVLLENTLTDSSTISEINYVETAHNVSFKGLSGMNSDRSYGLDKRTYDDSMINLVAMSTGFASTVGVNRQTTVDMNIQGTRGYIKTTTNKDDMNDVNSLSITEALTPFGTVSDDPFRTAMTLVQTSKHSMRVAHGSPNLVTNGADDAIAYMTPDIFSYKSKGKGKIIERTEDYLVIEYTDGSHDFVDLREKVYKNSDGGFFVTIKLDSDLKEGASVKENQVVAYDKLSYSTNIGYDDNPTLNNGMLTKVAICTTDEGYEDSGIMSDWLAKAMSSDVVVEKEYVFPKNTNIYNIVKKGQAIQEGDPLLVFQHAFDDADVNALLKNLTDDEDAITDIGRIPIRSKITGVVQDIIVYRTVEKEELSPSLRKIVDEYESRVNKTRRVVEKYSPDQAKEYDANYKLAATGKLKDAADSVKIVFYLKYKDDMSIGDKTVMNSALKSVMKDIFPKGQEPTSEFRPDEPIESFLAMSSVNARMVTSVFRNGLINKIMIELDRKIKEMNGIEWKNLRDI